jgi:hypothetical protein
MSATQEVWVLTGNNMIFWMRHEPQHQTGFIADASNVVG